MVPVGFRREGGGAVGGDEVAEGGLLAFEFAGFVGGGDPVGDFLGGLWGEFSGWFGRGKGGADHFEVGGCCGVEMGGG